MSQPPPPGGWTDPQATPGAWADPDATKPSEPSPTWADPHPPAGPATPGAAPGATPGATPGQPDPTQPLYPGASYGPAAASPPGYGYAPYGYPYVPAPKTNGMAVAAMVVSIVGAVGLCAWGVGGLIGVVGALLGHVARRQIRTSGEAGDGMALAGVIVGWIAFAIGLIAVGVFAAFIIAAANSPEF